MSTSEVKIIHQDEVCITDGVVERRWWRGVVEVKGGTRYFSMALPVEGDRMELLRKALANE